MSLRWHAVVVDCHDARVQSQWWAEVLGWEIACEGDDDEVVVLPPHSADKAREIVQADRWPGLLSQGIPEGHQLQNRTYLTLAPPVDGDQQGRDQASGGDGRQGHRGRRGRVGDRRST